MDPATRELFRSGGKTDALTAANKFLDVLCQDINLDIYPGVCTVRLQSRVLERMGNDGKAQQITFDFGYRQTDAVDSERAFAHNVTSDVFRHSNSQPPVIVT